MVVDTLEDKFILDVGTQRNSATAVEINLVDVFTTQKVFDLDASAVLGDCDVNGEMSVNQSHFVLVAIGDAGNHVGDQRFDGGDRARLLVEAEPHS